MPSKMKHFALHNNILTVYHICVESVILLMLFIAFNFFWLL